jgi:hypothetical protein
MKTKFKILLSVMMLAATVAWSAPFTTLFNGTAYTNFSAAVGGGTNTSGAYTNNVQVGVILAASTNYYTLGTGTGTQPAQPTSSWPSCGFSPAALYPGTLYGPFNNLGIYQSLPLQATNASSTALTIAWAGSPDGVYWVSNYFVETYTIPVNSFLPSVPSLMFTNISTGALPYMCLQSIINPGANAITNAIIEVGGKPGL